MKQQKKQKRRKTKRFLEGSTPRNISENKLAVLNMLYEYHFEYGVDFKNRTITLTEELYYPAFDILDAGLSQMEADSGKAITIKIKSCGGSVYDSMAIVGRLKRSKCQIITEGYGEIMSAACPILACGDKRRISRYAWFMWHEASYEYEGRTSSHKATLAQIEREDKQWAKVMSEFSDKSEKFWLATGVNKDAYFNAEELLKMGVVDEII